MLRQVVEEDNSAPSPTRLRDENVPLLITSARLTNAGGAFSYRTTHAVPPLCSILLCRGTKTRLAATFAESVLLGQCPFPRSRHSRSARFTH